MTVTFRAAIIPLFIKQQRELIEQFTNCSLAYLLIIVSGLQIDAGGSMENMKDIQKRIQKAQRDGDKRAGMLFH